MRTVNFSEFIRQPTKALTEAGGQEILLKRRGGQEDLLVCRAGAHRGHLRALGQLQQVMATSLGGGQEEVMSAGVIAQMPWVEFLPLGQREVFTREYLRTARACLAIGDMTRLEAEVEAWRETARAYSLGIAADGQDLHVLAADEDLAVADPRSA